jgi:uncharacterized protein HemY
MRKITKRAFFKYMSALYEDRYRDDEAYDILLDILKRSDDPKFLNRIRELADMDQKERLQYRYAMAVQGKEFTPTQVDQYVSLVKYALKHIDTSETP